MLKMMAVGRREGEGEPIVIEAPPFSMVNGKLQAHPSGEDAYWACMMAQAGDSLVDWRGEPVSVKVCPSCGGTMCDCLSEAEVKRLRRRIDADPHGYNNLTDEDIPY